MKRLSDVLRFVVWFVAIPTLAGCATTPPGGAPTNATISLPVTFDSVWYRTAKVRILGTAYEASGVLTVREGSMEFSHQDGTVRISGKDIERVSWGKLSPDIMNDWVIIHFKGGEPGALAAFKGALFSGITQDRLYAAVLLMAKDK